jgi:translation initiation factor IF-2
MDIECGSEVKRELGMSRVRIYELAKEAGMSSKALASKLIAQGYEVKGHSSTVDDETAEKIRSTVLQESKTELVEKRISATAGSTVIRRRSTIIRRKSQDKSQDQSQELEDSVEEPADEAEEQLEAEENSIETHETEESVNTPDVEQPEIPVEPVVAEESVEKKPAIVESGQVEPLPEPVEAEVNVEEKADSESQPEIEVEPEVEAQAEESIIPVAEEPVAEPVAEVQEDEVRETEVRETEVKVEPEVKAEPKKPVAKKEKPEKKRKGLARVVGTIDIPIEEKKEPPRPRKKGGKPAGSKRPPARTAAPVSLPPAEDARGRKKGKRGAADTDSDRKQGKGGKKGKKGVKFTHFGNEYQRSAGKRGKRGGKGRAKAVSQPPSEMKASKKRIKVYDTITVGDLASRMKVKANEVIVKLMGLGVMATMNQAVDVETAMLIAADFGYEVEQGITEELGIQLLEEKEEGGATKPRSPVVTVMGHVDHGKTSILDAIRKTDVADGEAGGITQHIGAYHVHSSAGDVTFVDTPGHAAFTEMRSRGAQVTDLVILVVAADDGVMDQTREAIHHAQAAEVPIIVAVNKIDKDNADPDRVKRELAELDLAPEEWGGQTMYCETSAKKNLGIDNLMESIQLMAEMLELEADANRKARGRVIEAQLDKGRGSVATVLVQEGTLNTGDHFVVGQYAGKVRGMLDYKGRKIDKAGPSIPVEVQGLSGVPSAGDEFVVVTDEKMAKTVSHSRSLKARESELGASSKISLDKLFEQMNEGDVKELRVVIRADVQGTLEAFAKAAEELSTSEIKVRVLHEGTGTITESDILLASASEAIIIGFNVRPSMKVKDLASKENVDVRAYDVIYHALDDIRKAMVGLLDPTFEEDVIGVAEVRETFSVPKIGKIAGCSIISGKIQRKAGIRVLREGVVVYTGKIGSLRRFKDDVKEVLSGFECGIGVENFNDIKVGDNLEAFVMLEVEATLTGGE